MPGFLIYGSYGYTGRLIAEQAVRRGLRPALAGRDAARLERQAQALGLEARPCSLADAAGLEAALAGLSAVLHCAGPFSHTAAPMADACLRAGAHYLDITGEIAAFEALAQRGQQARERGVMLLPGVGFDVVPSDCLAAHLKRRLPSAVKLRLAFRGLGRASHGTLLTALEGLPGGGWVRRGGQITPVPAAWKGMAVDFGRGPVQTVTIPWGDVATAFYSTGIPDIETYIALPAAARRLLVASRRLGPALGSAPVQSLLKRLVRALPEGPSPAERARGQCLLWADVRDNAGQRRAARLRTPESYTLTAQTALAAVEKTLAGQAPPGFQTPALAFGPDFILEMEGVTRADLDDV